MALVLSGSVEDEADGGKGRAEKHTGQDECEQDADGFDVEGGHADEYQAEARGEHP
ncbi:hypothetical protein [Actinomadura roseirufa]|uniref:hypothetical protein n=1 Tax=Actinomadura roseirufa TaxID=2094049 RepID=UPI0013F171D9|nr:hypothetical protein [Actinomadura roseirufa]